MNEREERLERAFAAIDARNADDPHRIVVRGEERPKEIAHAELVSEWVRRLRPDAGDALLLAARGHHLRRWTIPRSSYPDGRSGYLRWRRALHDVHADEIAQILGAQGYDAETVTRAQAIVKKRDLKDPDVQALEDALCLVFLETQLDELAARLDDEKMVEVLRKSLVKMSAAGRRLAAEVPLSARGQALVALATG